MAEVVIKRAPDGGFKQLAAELEDELGPLLDLIGQRLKEFAIQNIRTSSFGGESWKQQYPNLRKSEFIHMAGALSDLNKGQAPKARRFTRKPPLRDTSRLLQSIAFRHVGKTAVECGTTLEYAPTHQFGLKSEMPVTEAARKKFKSWSRRAKMGKVHGHKLAREMEKDTLETQVVERPFIGISDRIAAQVRIDVEEFLTQKLEEKSDGES